MTEEHPKNRLYQKVCIDCGRAYYTAYDFTERCGGCKEIIFEEHFPLYGTQLDLDEI